ncbi:hypothetical protein RHGRI_008623 [Rhododendron griersonianum]|uniref:Timeless N-terminal domain-containing protein n=1 Tax=Rhododendron griersonianum TaxID=479676 RepID=A0AAV6L257_9ERIC|nr:hypothetical protein RHGRI_008623 [Rhododendron griersonianum]
MEGLSAICAGLGIIEEDDNGGRIGYTKGEYCLDNLKDLLRFLRRDDQQTREVFKQVCKWNIVGKDLIPILEHCQDDNNLVLNAVKVLVFLTMPVEPTSNDIPQQIEYLWALKSSITLSDTVPMIVSLLESPLENLECDTFTEDDWKLVQLVVTLFRNILAIQEIPPHQMAGATTQFLSLRDKFLELLFNENVMDLILVLTQNIGGSSRFLRQDNLLLLETFHYVVVGQEPELIAKAYSKDLKVNEDAETSIDSLRSIMEEEAEKRKLTRLRNVGCSSQFSGAFTRLTMDGSKTLFMGNPCSASHGNLLKSHKVQHRGPLKRMVWDYERLPSTKDKILELLHDFVNQLVSGGYNVLMQSIREDIEKEHIIESSDVAIFFQVAQFVTSFQYQKSLFLKPETNADVFEASLNHHADSTLFKGNICGPIAASMNESMFLLLFSKWQYAYDGLKETKDYKFVSAAGSLMKIMIRMLDLVLKASPEDSKEPQMARILLYKLFYDQTDQGMTQFLLNQIKSFDIHKQAKSDLSDLIETAYVVIRLMENLQERGTLRVSRKSRKKRAKKMLNDKSDNIDQPVGDHNPLQNEIANSGCEPGEDHTPFQNKVGNSGCEHYANSSMLSEEKFVNPISDAKQDEAAIPVQVNEPETCGVETSNHKTNLQGMKNNKSDEHNGDLHDGMGDSSCDEQLAGIDEVDFRVSTLISALANNNIIQNLCWLLKSYKSNSTSTNHYILCMLRKICDDLELSPMLYQLSFLNIFYKILDEQKSSPCKEYENIVLFLTSLVRRMLRKMKKQPLLFVEVLFWKTRKECHYINCESLLHEVGNLKRESEKWGSVSNDEGIYSSQGQGWVHRSIADALGDDEADFVDPNEINKQKHIIALEATNWHDLELNSLSLHFCQDICIHESFDSWEEDPYEIKIQKVFRRSKGNNGQVKENVKSVSSGGSHSKEISDSEGIIEHESEGVSKRRKSLVLNQDLEGKIKGLYEKYIYILVLVDNSHHFRNLFSDISVSVENNLRYKDDRHCSHLIAEELDPDGKVSPVQVSNKLRRLGLRVPRQKRRLQAGGPIQLEEEGARGDENDLSKNEFEESSALRQPLHTRKRVRAFSKDQEMRIKALFEQFKDHKRCSHMIANAMDADGIFTAAQVSRKLKQLGLRVPKRKRSEGHMHSRDEDPVNFSAESAEDSDNETLLSLVKRRKSKKNEREIVVADENNDGEGNSDDELPGAALRQVQSLSRDGEEQPSGMEGEFDENSLDYAANAEAEASILGSEKQVGAPLIDDANHLQHQQMHDELADELSDFGEDATTPVASPKDAVLRRKMRMVLDLEDDD